MGAGQISVLIADDDVTFRSIIRSLIDDEDDMHVVAEASDGEETIARATAHAPNVILMDIRMPKLSGIEAARRLYEIHPSAKVLILTVSDEPGDIFEAIKAGASGYLLKVSGADRVAEAVRTIHAGQTVLSPPIVAKLLPALASSVDDGDPDAERPLLTNPERKVLQDLAAGRSPEEVARDLGTSASTVNNHLLNVVNKLHLQLRIQAAFAAHREDSADEVDPLD